MKFENCHLSGIFPSRWNNSSIEIKRSRSCADRTNRKSPTDGYSLGEHETAGRAAPPGDPKVEAELARLNRLDAESIRTYDAAAKIARYADDAIYMPYADTPKVGIDEIRAHLVRYTEQGRGVTFESVRVWNEGFEVLDGYVVEYPKFEVRWRNGADSGIVSGGGLRLWRRQADGARKMFRQIATHDHRA